MSDTILNRLTPKELDAIQSYYEQPLLDRIEQLEAIIEMMRPLVLYHQSGGHEGNGSDEHLNRIEAALQEKI